jgi:hypothetical protein
MAYDLEYSNYARAPLSCSRFCLGPTAPLTGYYYNDTATASQYASAVGPSKVILGVPYYGRKSCVATATPNQYPTSSVRADAYLDASGEPTAAAVKPGSFAAHRDAHDTAGQERWDTWFNTEMNCIRELYWDDVTSLSQKYALISRDGLRGVGIWTLNYGGGARELWSALNTYFSCPVGVTVPSPVTTTEFSIGLSAPNCSVASYEVQQFDSTQNKGWYPLRSTVAEGFRGYTYQFRARPHTGGGLVGQWSYATATVAADAVKSHPYSGVYTLDDYGGIHADTSPPLSTGAYWAGWKIARAGKALPGALPQSGAVLDGYGGLHSYGVPLTFSPTPYWRGWDIARDFAFLPDGSGGYVLDGYGGLHPFGVNGHAPPPAAQGSPYWGWNIARKVVIFSDGSGGYVMDGYGGLHAFGIGRAAPAAATGGPYWAGWQIARDLVLVPGSHAGYILDGYGGLHPFSGAAAVPAPSYWRGWDIARSVWLLPASTPAAPAGYVLDGWGGLHPFGGAPSLSNYDYWPGSDVAHNLMGF